MATPKKKMSKHRSRQRRAINLRLSPVEGLVICEECKQRTLPHRACIHCGFYRGEKIAA